MDKNALQELVKDLVVQAKTLKNKYTSETDALVNYACIFAQSDAEYKELTEAVQMMGVILKETNSGFLYRITDLETVAGTLYILKIRTPDVTRPERGDADFTVSNYMLFKNEITLKQILENTFKNPR